MFFILKTDKKAGSTHIIGQKRLLENVLSWNVLYSKDPQKKHIIGQKRLFGNVLVIYQTPINSSLDIMTVIPDCYHKPLNALHTAHCTLHTAHCTLLYKPKMYMKRRPKLKNYKM